MGTREDTLAARYFRKGAGRIGKREARRLARRELAGCLGGTDFLANRNARRHFESIRDWPASGREFALEGMRRFAVDKYFHYGPRYGRWPGEAE